MFISEEPGRVKKYPEGHPTAARVSMTKPLGTYKLQNAHWHTPLIYFYKDGSLVARTKGLQQPILTFPVCCKLLRRSIDISHPLCLDANVRLDQGVLLQQVFHAEQVFAVVLRQ